LGVTVAAVRWLVAPVAMPPSLLWLAALLLVLGAILDTRWLPLRLPSRHVQVDDMLRRTWPWWLYLPLYGATLGLGLLTYVPFAALFVLVACALLVGGPAAIGAFIAYGVARATLPVMLAALTSRARIEEIIRPMLRMRGSAQAASALSQLVLAISLVRAQFQ
ncbi:MAG: hypothetical protein M3Q61_00960, partial [Chloroflexota bacterium]|nr:hypothetical protein [Chloroflexota bacterium]